MPDKSARRLAIDSLTAALCRALEQASAEAAGPDPCRRRFLQAGAGALLGAALPTLTACGGSEDNGATAAAVAAAAPSSLPITRTFFFNHAHLDHAGKVSYLQVGHERRRLVPIEEAPHVLARERAANRFLAAVPDAGITHVVEDVPMDPAYSRPSYVWTALGDNQMTIDAVYLKLPGGVAARQAFDRMRAKTRAGRSPALSARRRRYGVPAAQSWQDLADEHALLDPVAHAQALTCWRTPTLSLDAATAYVVLGYADDSNSTDDLADRITALGTASPAVSPDSQNPTGWATLTTVKGRDGKPLTQADPAQPGVERFVYTPTVHPDVATLVAKAALNDIEPAVRQDAGLGADVTSRPSGQSLRGKLWVRSDGTTTRPASAALPPAAASQKTEVAVNWVNSGSNAWFDFSVALDGGSGGPLVLDFTFTNKALRYLGCFVEFYDRSGALLPLSTMPGFSDKTWIESPPTRDYGDGTGTRQYLGVIAPIGTVMGIPVYTDATFWSSIEGRMKLSADVSKIRVYAGGAGWGGGEPGLIAAGAAGTALVSYALTMVFGFIGGIDSLTVLQATLAQIAGAIFNILGGVIVDVIDGEWVSDGSFWKDVGMSLLATLLASIGDDTIGIAPLARAVAGAIGAATAEASIKEAIPIVGLIFNIESVVVTLADIALTTVQIIQSPAVYIAELSLTHKISVTLTPDCGNTVFPLGANLLRAVLAFDASQQSVTFDRTVTDDELRQKRLEFDLAPGPGQAPIPRGGKCSISVQFLYRTPQGDDTLLGSGTTGRVDNLEPAVFTIPIQQKDFPVDASTTYQHRQRLYRDASKPGNPRLWSTGPAPTLDEGRTRCGVAGNVCQFNDFVVRQGTSDSCGAGTITAVGYGWRALDAGADGDREHYVLLDATSPERAYAAGGTVQQGVPHLGFSVAAGGAPNYYVDSSAGTPLVRLVQLDAAGGPTVDGPTSQRAVGALNLASAALLVHPNGSIVSVCASADRLEVLRPAPVPVDDATARRDHKAVILGITGSLPGQFSNVINATLAPDGTLLVLEGGTNNRIQAFDLGMNAVRYFPGAAAGVRDYTLALTDLPTAAGWEHLDVEADIGGLIYVLSRNLGSNPPLYRVTIYNRERAQLTPVTHVDGVFAMRIALDHWRTLYSLNMALLLDKQSGLPLSAEPSISYWEPAKR